MRGTRTKGGNGGNGCLDGSLAASSNSPVEEGTMPDTGVDGKDGANADAKSPPEPRMPRH